MASEATRTSSRRGVLRATVGLAAVATGASGLGAAQESPAVRPDFDDYLVHDGAPVDGGHRDARGEDAVTVTVGGTGNGGPFAFAPASLWIDPGTTVTFDWVSDNHTVTPETVPGDATWAGSPETTDTGYVYEHTFETTGIYTYYCEPHLPLGMKGGIAVGDDVPTRAVQTPAPPPDDPGGGLPPETDVVALFYGLVGAAALVLVGAEGWRYVGDHGGVRGPAPSDPDAPTPTANAAEPTRTIGHDEYDPTGTATLVLLYFLLVAALWVFMYFVEFLGNGPSVIG